MANTVAADDRPRHFSVPFGDGGNPSPSGEERIVVMWSRAPLPIRSAHENGPESAPGVDTEISEKGARGSHSGSCARSHPADRDGTRAAHPFGESCTRPRPRFPVSPCASGYQYDRAMAKRHKLSGTPSGVSPPEEEVLGAALLGPRISGGQFRNHYRRDG